MAPVTYHNILPWAFLGQVPSMQTQQENVPKFEIGVDEVENLTISVAAGYFSAKAARVPMTKYKMVFEAINFATHQFQTDSFRLVHVEAEALHPKVLGLFGGNAQRVIAASVGAAVNLGVSIYNKWNHGKFQGVSLYFAALGVGNDEAAMLEMGTVATADLAIVGGAIKLGLMSAAAATGMIAAGVAAVVALPVGAALLFLHRHADQERQKPSTIFKRKETPLPYHMICCVS